MDSIDKYTRTWVQREELELDTLSEWVKSVRSLILCQIHKLRFCVKAGPKSVFKDKKPKECVSPLHDKYVIVPANKASNNIVLLVKKYNYGCLILY